MQYAPERNHSGCKCEVIGHSDYIAQSLIDKIESKKREILIEEAKLREQIGNALVRVRSGHEECKAIEMILDEFQSMPLSIYRYIAEHALIKSLIQRIRLAEKQKVFSF